MKIKSLVLMFCITAGAQTNKVSVDKNGGLFLNGKQYEKYKLYDALKGQNKPVILSMSEDTTMEQLILVTKLIQKNGNEITQSKLNYLWHSKINQLHKEEDIHTQVEKLSKTIELNTELIFDD